MTFSYNSVSELIETLDLFTKAYITCALWSTTDESDDFGGSFLDDNYSIDDLTLDALKSIITVCQNFQESHAKLLAQAGDEEQNGHDFWLTRNGHGAGFWDRGYPKSISDPLCQAAHLYGTCELFVTPDGKIDIA